MTTTDETTPIITEHEAEQIERANATGLQPVVFIHGLWLLPSSWDRWRGVFEAAGYATVAPGDRAQVSLIGDFEGRPVSR